MSSFTWLDFSERERRQALDVIDLFREEETRDELGIGTIRDALSDLFFPGTTTIQTRARYFLFVPWVYRDLESRTLSLQDIQVAVRKSQGRVRDGLVEAGETNGVIGMRAGHSVQRLPSSVYWQGLRRWGILHCQASEEQCHRLLANPCRQRRQVEVADDGETTNSSSGSPWDPALPDRSPGFPKGISFALTREEAEYLVDRILATCHGTLLAELVQRRADGEGAVFPWEHPIVGHLPARLVDQLRHARNFSESLQGAALLYNLMLAEKGKQEDRTQDYRDRLEEWWSGLQSRWQELLSWGRDQFWNVIVSTGARVPFPTRTFVDVWLDALLRAGSLPRLCRNQQIRQLILQREAQLKGGRARLSNARALELWTGASGTAQIDYRWNRPVKTMLGDILEDFSNEVPHA